MDALKKHFVAIVIGVAGFAAFAMGATFDNEDAELLANSAGGLFASVSAILVWAKSKRSDPPSGGATVAALLLAVSLIGTSGCDTSKAFQMGTERVGARLAKNADAYLSKDPTLTTEAKLDRQSKIAELRASVADAGAITYELVATRWPPVRAILVPYIDADPRFADGKAPDIKASKLFTVGVMDRLLQAEKARRAVLGLFGDEGVQKAAAAATQPAN